MRILLVEDDSCTADFIAKGLQQSGYVVDWACDGEDGLHRLTTEPYEVAVVDVMLPKLDGLQLIKRARGSGSPRPTG